ncbi:MAG: transposase [Terriglobia bacterium]
MTAKTWQRRELFKKETIARILIETMLECRKRGFYRLHDFVVMPDHLHAILTPSQDTPLEKAMQMVKGGSSYRIGRELRSKFPIWQPGFHEHWIRSQDDYEQRCRYIELNPVTDKLAATPQEYPYSSASGRFELDAFVMTSGAKALTRVGPATAGLKPRPAKNRMGGVVNSNENREGEPRKLAGFSRSGKMS